MTGCLFLYSVSEHGVGRFWGIMGIMETLQGSCYSHGRSPSCHKALPVSDAIPSCPDSCTALVSCSASSLGRDGSLLSVVSPVWGLCVSSRALPAKVPASTHAVRITHFKQTAVCGDAERARELWVTSETAVRAVGQERVPQKDEKGRCPR